VPKDIWVEIFKKLPKNAEVLFTCRLVCKSWATAIAVSTPLWLPLLKKLVFGESLWEIAPGGCTLSTCYAQLTMRGFRQENATLEWLARCFELKRWDLLFQTLAPLMLLNVETIRDDDKYLNRMLIRPDCRVGMNNVKWQFKHYWGNNRYRVDYDYGNFFAVVEKHPLFFTPCRIIFRYDNIKGHSLRTTVSSWREEILIPERFIWFGVQCMWKLWECYKRYDFHEETKKEIERILTLLPS